MINLKENFLIKKAPIETSNVSTGVFLIQMTIQRHFGLLYPIGPALSFNKWINPNSPREVSFSDVEKQAIVGYLKRVENGEVSSNMDQYAGMTNSYEGYIGENNIFGQPLVGRGDRKLVDTEIGKLK
ncbi:hypothetical protein [Sutcliffiella cohnii]|uniref:hypothetical protein n=1 Tax=Sutcliffiella cohnii TaxID=33932 RepID=UPI002E1E69C9|nr:hypothetical protein [Sutcliffiella cohnii]